MTLLPNVFVIGSFPIWPGWSKWFESIQTIIWIAGIEITRKSYQKTKIIFYRNNEIEFFQLFNSSDGLIHCHDKIALKGNGIDKMLSWRMAASSLEVWNEVLKMCATTQWQLSWIRNNWTFSESLKKNILLTRYFCKCWNMKTTHCVYV